MNRIFMLLAAGLILFTGGVYAAEEEVLSFPKDDEAQNALVLAFVQAEMSEGLLVGIAGEKGDTVSTIGPALQAECNALSVSCCTVVNALGEGLEKEILGKVIVKLQNWSDRLNPSSSMRESLAPEGELFGELQKINTELDGSAIDGEVSLQVVHLSALLKVPKKNIRLGNGSWAYGDLLG